MHKITSTILTNSYGILILSTSTVRQNSSYWTSYSYSNVYRLARFKDDDWSLNEGVERERCRVKRLDWSALMAFCLQTQHWKHYMNHA